jgi:hypothetical protein
MNSMVEFKPFIQFYFRCPIYDQYAIKTTLISYFFVLLFRRGPVPPEQIVVTQNTPAMQTMAAQLTEDNEDFAERGRYHQSEVVKGDNFDDYNSE